MYLVLGCKNRKSLNPVFALYRYKVAVSKYATTHSTPHAIEQGKQYAVLWRYVQHNRLALFLYKCCLDDSVDESSATIPMGPSRSFSTGDDENSTTPANYTFPSFGKGVSEPHTPVIGIVLFVNAR